MGNEHESNGSNNFQSVVAAGVCNDAINLNTQFEDGLNKWSARGCKILLRECLADGKIESNSQKYFACATDRTDSWNGIQQEINGRMEANLHYEAIALVRVLGNQINSANVQATIRIVKADDQEQYIPIANVVATDTDWVQLQGKFVLNDSPKRAIIFVEGPPAGIDILVSSFVVKPEDKNSPVTENYAFGANIIQNYNLSDGINGWFPRGDCILGVATGSPVVLPPIARDSPGPHEPLTGRCIVANKRISCEMGPSQTIADRVLPFLTYQACAWVKIGNKSGAVYPQNVNLVLADANSRMIHVVGEVEIEDERWHEIGGSFSIVKQQPPDLVVSVQGPASGVDLMVAGLQIFPVAPEARFNLLKNQSNKIRKRNVILKFCSVLAGFSIKVKQTKNSFYQDRLTRNTLFLKDYNITKSSPEKYIKRILDSRKRGITVAGIGVEGHINGSIVCSNLDKLAVLGLPIWFTEKASTINELVKGDDTEVILREAFAHPAVDGIVVDELQELFKNRNNSHLIALENEWLTSVDGHINQEGEFRFRGFLGTYEVELAPTASNSNKFVTTFAVDKGDSSSVVVYIDLNACGMNNAEAEKLGSIPQEGFHEIQFL